MPTPSFSTRLRAAIKDKARRVSKLVTTTTIITLDPQGSIEADTSSIIVTDRDDTICVVNVSDVVAFETALPQAETVPGGGGEDTGPGGGELPEPRRLSLKGWKLTTPHPKADGFAQEVFQPELDKLHIPGVFEQFPKGARMACRVDGAKTSSQTKYARCELRECKADEADEQDWLTGKGEHGIRAVYTFGGYAKALDGKTPARVVIGQIHGSSKELLRIYARENHPAYFVDDMAGSGVETKFQFAGPGGEPIIIKPGDLIEAVVSVTPTDMRVVLIRDGVVYGAAEPLSDHWKRGDWAYGKWGVYQGLHNMPTKDSNSGVPDSEAWIVLHELSIWHSADAVLR